MRATIISSRPLLLKKNLWPMNQRREWECGKSWQLLLHFSHGAEIVLSCTYCTVHVTKEARFCNVATITLIKVSRKSETHSFSTYVGNSGLIATASRQTRDTYCKIEFLLYFQ